MQWYIKKIRHTQPELLDYNEVWLRDWIDTVVVEQEDVETVDRLNDVIKDAEDYYGIMIDYMSKLQLLSVVARMMEILGI